MNDSGRNQTVMIVDDADDIRDLLRVHLQILGYRVMEAANGKEAIELIRNEVPKLILMDLTMPELDGIEATRLIRQTLTASSTVIIAFTSLSEREIRKKALAAGCNDYLQKPFEATQLSSLLNRHLPPVSSPSVRQKS